MELALIAFGHRHCLVHAVLLVDPHDVHEDRVSVALGDVVAALVVVDLLSDVAGLAKKKVQVAYDMALLVMPKLWTPALRWHLSTEVGDPKRKNLLCCEYQWTRECSGGQYCHRTYRIGYLQKKNHAVLPEDSMFYGASKATRGPVNKRNTVDSRDDTGEWERVRDLASVCQSITFHLHQGSGICW